MSTDRIAEVKERVIKIGSRQPDDDVVWVCAQMVGALELIADIAECYYERVRLPQEWVDSVMACEECRRRRVDAEVPGTVWCNQHYPPMSSHIAAEDRKAAAHDQTLREMARKWLEGRKNDE